MTAPPGAALCERRRSGGAVLAAIAMSLMSGLALSPVRAQQANPTGAAVLEFHKRLEEYVKLRERAVADVPRLKETPSPGEIETRETRFLRFPLWPSATAISPPRWSATPPLPFTIPTPTRLR